MCDVPEKSESARAKLLARVASVVTPGRAAVGGALLVSSVTAFASGSGIGANSAATYITGTIIPDVGIVAGAIALLAATIYGIKWFYSMLV